VKESRTSLVLALARKGVLDIPMLFLFNRLLPPFGLAWATPIADFVCCGMALLFVTHYLKARGAAAVPGVAQPAQHVL